MTYLWHQLMNSVWTVLLVLGFIFGAIVWVLLAVGDGIRGLLRRLFGEDG